MRVIGIDPGKNQRSPGGIAYIDIDIKQRKMTGYGALRLGLTVTEVAHQLGTVLSDVDPAEVQAVVEQLWGRGTNNEGGRNTANSIFKLAQSYGEVTGVLASNHICTHYVTPRSWQDKAFGKEVKGRDEKKRLSVRQARERFPDVSLTNQELDNGKADALWIAAWFASQYCNVFDNLRKET